MTGRCETVTGKRRERELLIISHDASPAGLTLPPGLRHTHAGRHGASAENSSCLAGRAFWRWLSAFSTDLKTVAVRVWEMCLSPRRLLEYGYVNSRATASTSATRT